MKVPPIATSRTTRNRVIVERDKSVGTGEIEGRDEEPKNQRDEPKPKGRSA
jgi:hypothetical protein